MENPVEKDGSIRQSTTTEYMPDLKIKDNIFSGPIDVEVPQEIKRMNTEDVKQFLQTKKPENAMAGIRNSGGTDEIAIESKSKPSKIEYKTLLESTKGSSILHNLGVIIVEDDGPDRGKILSGEEHLFTIEEIIYFLQQQMQLENGRIKVISPIQPDAYPANVFYVKGLDGKARSFRCYWNSLENLWNVASKDFDHEWLEGARVFSCK